MKLKIFYDSHCPLCMAEINQLIKLDKKNDMSFISLHHENFNSDYPHIDPVKADKVLHGKLANGEIIYGLDVTAMAWSLVGKHKWLKLLRWPVVRIFADLLYTFFARYRNIISRIFMGKSCNTCYK